MVQLQHIFGAATIIVALLFIFRRKHRIAPAGYHLVPEVAGAYPVVGHGIAFGLDIIKFVREAYRKYGGIFKVKIFNKKMVVVCDHALKDEYFKMQEPDMSLYSVLDGLYFSDAFSDDPSKLAQIINMLKSTVAVDFNKFAPKIMAEAQRMINRMKLMETNQKLDIQDEMIRFVSHTSARCFMDMELTEEFYDVLLGFTHLLNHIVILT